MPKIEKKQKNAVIYARFSCDKQRDESIEDQLRVCNEYAAKNGYHVVDQYCDFAISGRTDKRPQFQQMIKDAAEGFFQFVLIYKTDRFARNRWDSAIYKKQLHDNGVKVVSATEAIPDGGGGIIMESIYESWAELYSMQISQNVKRAATGNALKSKSNGGYTPFGYKINPVTRYYELDENTYPIAQEVFQQAALGKSLKSMLQYLDSFGYKFSYCKLNNMLRNERYTGIYIYGDVRNEGGLPAIISKETFKKVQIRLSGQRKFQRNPNKNYLFSKRCFCGQCGSTMTGEYGTNSYNQTYKYYSCMNHKMRHSCSMKRLRADIVEPAAVNVLLALITKPDIFNACISAALKYQKNSALESAEYNALYNELQDTKKRKENLLSAIEQGIITSTTTERLKALELQEENLSIKLAEKKHKLDTGKLSQSQLEYFLQQIKNKKFFDENFEKSLFQTLIPKVFLFADHILLVYDLQNNVQQSVTLESLADAEPIETRIIPCFTNKKSSEHKSVRSTNDWLPE